MGNIKEKNVLKPKRGSSKRQLVQEMRVRGESVVTHQTFVLPQEREPRVAIYVRVSTMGQAEDGNSDVQLAQCMATFKRVFKGDESVLVDRFTDDGYNLTAKEPGRQIWKLLELVERGIVNTIIVNRTDRFFRSSDPRIQGEILQILNSKTVVMYDNMGRREFDNANSTSTFVNQVEAGIGVLDKSKVVSTLQKARRTRTFERDVFIPSILPYGFAVEIDPTKRVKDPSYKTLVTVPEEFAIVEDIFRLYLGEEPKTIPPMERPANGRHASDKTIAKHLNRHGYTRDAYIGRGHAGLNATPSWTMSAVTYILTKPTYMGEMVVTFKEAAEGALYRAAEETKTFKVPAAVSAQTWDRVQKIRAKVCEKYSGRLKPIHDQEAFWLHGKLLCRVCGRTLKGRVASNLLRYYRCESKRRPGDPPHDHIRSLDVESLVEPRFRQYVDVLSSPEGVEELKRRVREDFRDDRQHVFVTKSLENKRKRLTDINREGDDLFAWFRRKTINEERFVAESGKLEAEKKAVAAEISALETQLIAIGRRDTPDDHSKRIDDIYAAISERPSTRLRELQLLALGMVEKIEIERLPPLDVRAMSSDQIRHHFMMGRVTVAQLKAEGWTTPRIHRNFGLSGRKTPLDWQLVVTFLGGRIDVISPAPNHIPPAVLPQDTLRKLRDNQTTTKSTEPVRVDPPTHSPAGAFDGGGLAEASRGQLQGPVNLERWGRRIPKKAISVQRVEDPRYLESRKRFQEIKEKIATGASLRDVLDSVAADKDVQNQSPEGTRPGVAGEH